MKRVIAVLGVLLVLLVVGCENVDLSKLSDKDLERVSQKLIVCDSPYMRHGSSCCVDSDSNKICDEDENKQVNEQRSVIVEEVIENEEIPVEDPVFQIIDDKKGFDAVFLVLKAQFPETTEGALIKLLNKDTTEISKFLKGKGTKTVIIHPDDLAVGNALKKQGFKVYVKATDEETSKEFSEEPETSIMPLPPSSFPGGGSGGEGGTSEIIEGEMESEPVQEE